MALSHTPTHDWIVARKRPLRDVEYMPVIHGVHRPNMVQPHHYADVVAVGPGRVYPHTSVLAPMPVRPGDVVMVRAMAGDPETIDGVEYHWFMPDEILATVKESSKLAVVS